MHQPPLLPQDAGPIFLQLLPARLLAVLNNQGPVRQLILSPLQQAREAGAVEPRRLRRREPAQIEQGRKQVLNLRQLTDVARLAESAIRPADEARGPVAAFVVSRLLPAHAGVEGLSAGCRAVVVEVNNDR